MLKRAELHYSGLARLPKVVLQFLQLDDARVEYMVVGSLLDISASDGDLDVTVSVRGRPPSLEPLSEGRWGMEGKSAELYDSFVLDLGGLKWGLRFFFALSDVLGYLLAGLRTELKPLTLRRSCLYRVDRRFSDPIFSTCRGSLSSKSSIKR